MTDVEKWSDRAMFAAAPMEVQRTDNGGIIPQVKMIWMTPDPLGAVAACCRMYEGIPTYSLDDITDEERRRYWEDVQQTHLQAPLEAIKMHFFLEGVTRSFTHQQVRQRTAMYAQESLRFAVKDNIAEEVSIPPSILALAVDDPRRQSWDRAVQVINDEYHFLVGNGIPAEDARGLLPHAITTRDNYVTDLRNLKEHAGNRLCTQAQFEWRIVFMGIVNAIRNFQNDGSVSINDEWQFDVIANSALFRPVCYQMGHCPFNASFDRGCKIKGRVEAHAAKGTDSKQWYDIRYEEWMLDPAAARYGGAGF